jgi:purine-binding chemotaxis protein CheW
MTTQHNSDNRDDLSQPASGKNAEDIISEVAQRTAEKEETVVLTEQFVTFVLDKEEYASLITDLREIIKIPDIVPIPGAPDFIRGILNLRGQIVVVIDLEKRFKLARSHQIEPRHIIIAEVGESVFGIVVDEVTGVLRVPKTSIKPTPELVTSRIHAEYMKGVVVLEETLDTSGESGGQKSAQTDAAQKDKEDNDSASRLLLVLDVPKMLSEQELLKFGSAIQQTVEEKQQSQNKQ